VDVASLIADVDTRLADPAKVIDDLAKAAGLKTAAIHWPATRNAHSLDWSAPDVGKEELVRKYATPELLAECKEAGLNVIYGDEGKTISRTESIAEDETLTKVFNMILHKHRPNLALLHVVAVDHIEDGARLAQWLDRSRHAAGLHQDLGQDLERPHAIGAVVAEQTAMDLQGLAHQRLGERSSIMAVSKSVCSGGGTAPAVPVSPCRGGPSFLCCSAVARRQRRGHAESAPK
jgi:hypothetical protein